MNGVTFVERVRKILIERNIKQTKLCNDIGITKTSFSHWEERGNIPSGDIVYKIANYLNVSMTYLITGEEPKYKITEDIFNAVAIEKGPEADFNPKPIVKELNGNEERLLNGYQFLSERGKSILIGMLDVLLDNDNESDIINKNAPESGYSFQGDDEEV